MFLEPKQCLLLLAVFRGPCGAERLHVDPEMMQPFGMLSALVS